MEKKRLICPSCKREHKDPDNCEHCGFNVKAYKEYAKTKQSAQADQSQAVSQSQFIGSSSNEFAVSQNKRSSKSLLLIVSVLVLGGAYLLLSERQGIDNAQTVASESVAKPIVQQTQTVVKPTEVKSVVKAQKIPDEEFLFGVAKRIDETHPARNEIEAARNATVFIKTEWDTLGSGFFIDDDCTIITNRHVIEEPLQRTREYQRRVDNNLNRIDDQLQSLNDDYQRAIRDGYRIRSRDIEKKYNQLRQDRTRVHEKIYQDMLEAKQSKTSDFVRNVSVDLSVSLVNGDEYQINLAKVSGKFDLAKLSLGDIGCPFLQKGRENNIIQGEKLYTIGSPSGLAYTVTSGIFSGYRERDEKSFLQTDAPINPGNSGGPLITEDGKIIGVNTSILANTEGIGFAIPFSVVEEEFFRDD